MPSSHAKVRHAAQLQLLLEISFGNWFISIDALNRIQPYLFDEKIEN